MEVIQDQIVDMQINIIKQGTCSSLSGRSKLKYSIGNTPDNELLTRIDSNSGTGKFNSEWISVRAILELIKKSDKPFHSSALKVLYEKKSLNSAGFLCAALLHLGLTAVAENSGYEPTGKDIKTLTKKPRSRRTTK